MVRQGVGSWFGQGVVGSESGKESGRVSAVERAVESARSGQLSRQAIDPGQWRGHWGVGDVSAKLDGLLPCDVMAESGNPW